MAHDAPQELRPAIELVYHTVNMWLGHIGCGQEVACSALMALTASLCAQSLETDEAIIESFKLCLLDARTRGKKMDS